MEEEGGMETEITKRVGAGWRNWKKCSGVLCDRRMPVKLKGKVYKTVIRPAMLYQGSKLGWSCGPSLPKLLSDHQIVLFGGPVVYWKTRYFNNLTIH